MLAKVTRNNQVTIPKLIAQKAHLKEGQDYVDVEYVNGVICLKPVDVEERIPDEAYEKLIEKAFKREPGDSPWMTAREAVGFLKKRMKK